MPNGISASQIAGHYIIHIFKKKKKIAPNLVKKHFMNKNETYLKNWNNNWNNNSSLKKCISKE